MADIKFNFSSFGKPKIKKTSNGLPRREIIHKAVIGIVGINLDGTYYVDLLNNKYPLTIESYDLKGKNIYYCIELQNNRTLEIISLTKKQRDTKKYLPFAVGSIVKGNLYKILGTPRFNISKILEYSDLDDSDIYYYKQKVKEIKKYFRDNYETILKCMI